MKGKNTIAILSVLLAGLVLGWLILYGTPAGHQPQGHEEENGELKHLRQESFKLAIGLVESPPRFEAAAYWDEKPIDPKALRLTVNLKRPNGKLEILSFEAKGDHLKSLKPVAEPHVFEVQATAQYQGKTYRWDYWQVEGGIELSSAALKDAGIELKTAGPAPIETVLTLPGQIQLDPRRVAHVVPRVEGVVAEVRKYLGDAVKQDEILAVLESRELAELKSQYLIALQRLELARAAFVRKRQLWKEKIAAELDYLVAKKEWAEARALKEAAGQKLIALELSPAELKAIAAGNDTHFNRYELRAPFAGEAVEKHLALGEALKADAKVYTIADLSTVWGEITVYTKDLSAVQVGQKVTVRAQGTDLEATGTLFYLGPLVGEQTRSAKAYVEIPNPQKRWRPGLFATFEVLQEAEKVPVAVAAEAVQTYRDQPVVFVRHGIIFEPRPVVPGRRDENWVEIRQGLAAGERYAARGSFALKSELGKSTAAHHH